MQSCWLPAKITAVTQIWESESCELSEAQRGWQRLPRFLSTGPLRAEHFTEHVVFNIYFRRITLISCSKNETLAWKWHIC